MARVKKKKSAKQPRYSANTVKYDAHHTVLSDTYGNFADLRRSLSDSKDDVDERGKILTLFSTCGDSQRAWLLLEDYFDKLKLSRKDFPGEEWWGRLMNAENGERLEELSMVFLRANRNLPSELLPHANFDRFAELEEAEKEEKVLKELEEWMFPPRRCISTHRAPPCASFSTSNGSNRNRNCTTRRLSSASAVPARAKRFARWRNWWT